MYCQKECTENRDCLSPPIDAWSPVFEKILGVQSQSYEPILRSILRGQQSQCIYSTIMKIRKFRLSCRLRPLQSTWAAFVYVLLATTDVSDVSINQHIILMIDTQYDIEALYHKEK